MKLADFVLRCLVRRRDRLTISGDLLEAYHDEILPARGAIGARLWYARQLLSLVSPVAWAIGIGVALNGWVLVDTARRPLAGDSGYEMLIGFAGVAVVAVAVSVRDAKHLGFSRAVWAGVSFGVVFGAIAYAGALVRVNVFLDQIRDRDDWVNLVARYQSSTFTSFRAYANYEYAFSAPFLLVFGALFGAAGGTIAAVIARLRPARPV
jgi:hypothetical protein